MARTLTGVVTSDKANKTIVISVATRKTHPLYKKQYTVNSKFMAHDEDNQAKVGDQVIIGETRPISARKRFKLIKIVERAAVGFAETDATADVPVEEIVKKDVKDNKPKAAEEPAAEATNPKETQE